MTQLTDKINRIKWANCILSLKISLPLWNTSCRHCRVLCVVACGIQNWRPEASPCSRAESVKPAGHKTSILDEGRGWGGSGVWKSFPTRCLYTELVLLFRWCSDAGWCYGNTYTLARHTRDRAGDRWGLDAFFFPFHFSPYFLFFFNRKCISLQWLISPPAYPCNTGWIEGYSMQISELSKTETRPARLLLNLSALHAAVQA